MRLDERWLELAGLAREQLVAWRRERAAEFAADDEFYEIVAGLLGDMGTATDAADFSAHVETLTRVITDSGPHSASFLPAFKKLRALLQAKHS